MACLPNKDFCKQHVKCKSWVIHDAKYDLMRVIVDNFHNSTSNFIKFNICPDFIIEECRLDKIFHVRQGYSCETYSDFNQSYKEYVTKKPKSDYKFDVMRNVKWDVKACLFDPQYVKTLCYLTALTIAYVLTGTCQNGWEKVYKHRTDNGECCLNNGKTNCCEDHMWGSLNDINKLFPTLIEFDNWDHVVFYYNGYQYLSSLKLWKLKVERIDENTFFDYKIRTIKQDYQEMTIIQYQLNEPICEDQIIQRYNELLETK